MKIRAWVTIAAGVLVFSSMGCATRGSLSDLEARVSALEASSGAHEKRMDDMDGRIGGALDTAEQSVRRAEGAEARAREAAERADDAARKADAIFRKSVSK